MLEKPPSCTATNTSVAMSVNRDDGIGVLDDFFLDRTGKETCCDVDTDPAALESGHCSRDMIPTRRGVGLFAFGLTENWS